jgi:undecaprenyl-diphosphatase
MTDWISALLGLVQGFTEFLPISSDGHLVIFEELLGVHQEGIVFEVAVHVATLVSVLIFFRAKVWALVSGALRGDADAWRYGMKMAVATLPAVGAGLFLLDFFEGLFDQPWTAGAGLLFTGAALWTTRTTLPRAIRDAEAQGSPTAGGEPTWLQALIVGCAQVLAIAPGISRSGTTMATMLALGLTPIAAAEFSFMIAIPAIVGAALLQALKAEPPSPELLRAMWVGGAVACVSGIAALAVFMRVLRAGQFYRFAWYAWAAGSAFLLWLALR